MDNVKTSINFYFKFHRDVFILRKQKPLTTERFIENWSRQKYVNGPQFYLYGNVGQKVQCIMISLKQLIPKRYNWHNRRTPFSSNTNTDDNLIPPTHYKLTS